MNITITDKKIITSACVSVVLSDEREIQAFKNLLSWAEQGLFLERDYKRVEQDHLILTELQKIKSIP